MGTIGELGEFGLIGRLTRRLPQGPAVLLGPGSGADERLAGAIAAALDSEAAVALDADCFRVLADRHAGRG